MIRTETHGRVAVIRIERPAKRNAIDGATTQQLDEARGGFQDDPRYWVGVLTGTADVFCAGTDHRDRARPALGGCRAVRGRRCRPGDQQRRSGGGGGPPDVADALREVAGSPQEYWATRSARGWS